MTGATKIEKCRICGNAELVGARPGRAGADGRVPPQPRPEVTTGPLRLVKCDGRRTAAACCSSRTPTISREMYGDNYGYRSGLNAQHGRAPAGARSRASRRGSRCAPATSCSTSAATTARRCGLPEAGLELHRHRSDRRASSARYYPPHVDADPGLLLAPATVREALRGEARRSSPRSRCSTTSRPDGVHAAKCATCSPTTASGFRAELHADDAATRTPTTRSATSTSSTTRWRRSNGWPTGSACAIVDVEFNDVNGGSFSVTAAKSDRRGPETQRPSTGSSAEEQRAGLRPLRPSRRSRDGPRTPRRRSRVPRAAKGEGKKVSALRAPRPRATSSCSTAASPSRDLAAVAEVNPDKFGAFTPGTLIPIVSGARGAATGGPTTSSCCRGTSAVTSLANPVYAGAARLRVPAAAGSKW